MIFSKQAFDMQAVVTIASMAGQGIDLIFENLLNRAFSGQLTAKWREAHMKELLAEMEQQARVLNLSLSGEPEAVQ